MKRLRKRAAGRWTSMRSGAGRAAFPMVPSAQRGGSWWTQGCCSLRRMGGKRFTGWCRRKHQKFSILRVRGACCRKRRGTAGKKPPGMTCGKRGPEEIPCRSAAPGSWVRVARWRPSMQGCPAWSDSSLSAELGDCVDIAEDAAGETYTVYSHRYEKESVYHVRETEDGLMVS